MPEGVQFPLNFDRIILVDVTAKAMYSYSLFPRAMYNNAPSFGHLLCKPSRATVYRCFEALNAIQNFDQLLGRVLLVSLLDVIHRAPLYIGRSFLDRWLENYSYRRTETRMKARCLIFMLVYFRSLLKS